LAFDDAFTASTSVTFPDNGSYVVSVQVTDASSEVDTASATVTVNNLDPVISDVAASSASVDEGGSSTITVSASDVPADTLAYEFDCDGDLTYEVGPQAANSTVCAFPDGPASVSVGVRVTDEDGGAATDSVTVPVANLDPVINDVSALPSTVDEGNGSVITVSASDVPADEPDLRYSFDCEDDGTYDFIDQADNFAGCSFPDGPATVTVRVRVDDQDGGIVTSTVSVTVNNLAPVIQSVGASPDTVEEGSSSLNSIGASDVAADTPDLRFSFDCDGDATYEVGPQVSSLALCTFPDGPATTTVGVKVEDQDGGEATGSVVVTVLNVAPTVVVSGDFSDADEGQTRTYTYTVTDPGADTPVVTEDCGTGATLIDTPAANSFDCSFPNGPASTTINVTADDGDPVDNIGDDPHGLNINNVAPLVTAGAVSGNEGASVSESASFSDAGVLDTHTCAINWGDGNTTPGTVTEAAGSGTCTGTHTYADNGSYTVTVTVTDNDGAPGSDTDTATIANVAPKATLANSGPVDEGSPVSVSFSGASDPSSADTTAGFHYAFACDNGSLAGATYAGSGTAASTTCTYPDEGTGTYTVRARIMDKDDGFTEYTTTVTVNNAAPLVTAGAVSGNEGASVSESGSFSDAGVLDTHTCAINWGDGNTTPGTVTEAAGSGTCAGTHTYADNGSYTVTVTVTDNDGAPGSDTDTATIANVAPAVNAGPDQNPLWASGGTAIALAPASFTDPGADSHGCSVTWGDAASSFAGTIAETVAVPTSGTCAAGHTYALPGVYIVTVTVCDDDSGCVADTLTVTIGLQFYGFLQPLNDPAVSTNTPSIWKRGSNIPLKFQLRDASGAPIPDSLGLAIEAACPTQGARVSIAKYPPGGAPPVWVTEVETSSSPTSDSGNCFRYSSGHFMFNLGTKTAFYTVLPDTYRATATVTFNGGVIASHTQANTFGLK
jgi:PKD repeat protein